MTAFVKTLWNERTLLAPGAFAESDWLDVSDKPILILARSMSGSNTAYQLVASWADTPEGVAIFTNEYTLADVSAGDTNIRAVSTLAPFVKFRVTNTGAGAFSTHTLHIGARGQV